MMKAGSRKNETLSFAEARDALGLTEGTFRRVVARREIGYRRSGSGRGWLRFERAHLEAWKLGREFKPRPCNINASAV